MATDITSVFVETMIGGPSNTGISSAFVETMIAPTSDTGISSIFIETMIAPDIDSTHISSVFVETMIAPPFGQIDISSVFVETMIGRVPDPVPVVLPDPVTPDVLRFGRDLVLELPNAGEDAGYVAPTVTGDWPAIGGRPNLRAAVRRRVVTVPGQVVHRPEYGAGLPLYVGRLATPAGRAEMANTVRGNVLRDDRIGEASVSASDLVDYPNATLVELVVHPGADTEPETVRIVSEE